MCQAPEKSLIENIWNGDYGLKSKIEEPDVGKTTIRGKIFKNWIVGNWDWELNVKFEVHNGVPKVGRS